MSTEHFDSIFGVFCALRPLARSELELVRNWRNSSDVAAWHADQVMITQEQQERWFDTIGVENGKLVWMIVAEGECLGVVHLKDISTQHSTAEVGLYIANPNARVKPFGAEAFFMVLDHAFNTMGLRKLYGHILGFNSRAQKLNTFFGFVNEGLFRKEFCINDEYVDYVRVGLFREEFESSPGFEWMVRLRKRG